MLALIGVAVSGFAESSGEVDSFLARPLDASSLTPELAKRWLDEGAQAAAGAGERSTEITAKLIPAQRVVDAATLPTAPPEAKPHPLLIIDNGTRVTVFKAQSRSVVGAVLEAVAVDGRKAAWQSQYLRSELNWFSPEDLASGSVDLPALEATYRSALQTYATSPDIALVRDELSRISAVQTRRQADAARALAATAAAAAPLLKQVYDPDAAHTRENLARRLVEAETLRRTADPALQAKLDAALAPFRAHFENLLAGRILDEGVWRSPAEVEARAREARYQLFEREFALGLPAVGVSAAEINRALTWSLVVLCAGVLIALACLIGKRSFLARFLGVVLLAGLGGGAFYYVQLLRGEPHSLAAPAPTDSGRVFRLLYLAGLSDPAQEPGAERSFMVSSADATEFLRAQVRWEGETNASDPVRRDLDVEWLANGAVVREGLAWRGRDYVVTYHLRFFGKPENLGVSFQGARVGAATLPDLLGEPLWTRLAQSLGKTLNVPAVQQRFRVTSMQPGQIRLDATYPAPPAPVPTPVLPVEPVVSRPVVAPAPEPSEAATPAPPEPSTNMTTEAVVSVAPAPTPAPSTPVTPAAPVEPAEEPATITEVDTKNPRVYVGSAYQPAMTDLSVHRDAWPKTGAEAGFHLHPVGWHPAFARWRVAEDILRGFKHHVFTSEEDIGAYSRGGRSMTWPSTLIREGQKYGQRWRCLGIIVNFGSVTIVGDPEKSAHDLREFCADARKAKVPVYLLFSPVSPSATKVFDELSTKTKGEYVWVRVAKEAKADGVAIDFPAKNVLSMNPKFVELAKTIATSTQKAGLKFIWVFNGGQGADNTEAAAKKLKRMNVRPDYWIVSHFHNREYAGTPEDGNDSVTSQSRVLIEGKF